MRKELELIYRARQLALEPRLGQRGLALGALHQLCGNRIEPSCNVAQKTRLVFAGEIAIADKCLLCQLGRAVQRFRGCIMERGLKRRAGRRIKSGKGSRACRVRFTTKYRVA